MPSIFELVAAKKAEQERARRESEPLGQRRPGEKAIS